MEPSSSSSSSAAIASKSQISMQQKRRRLQQPESKVDSLEPSTFERQLVELNQGSMAQSWSRPDLPESLLKSQGPVCMHLYIQVYFYLNPVFKSIFWVQCSNRLKLMNPSSVDPPFRNRWRPFLLCLRISSSCQLCACMELPRYFCVACWGLILASVTGFMYLDLTGVISLYFTLNLSKSL